LKVAKDCRKSEEVPMVTLSTAHPAKFPAAVEKACGIYPDLPAHMKDLFDREERFDALPNDLQTVQGYIRDRSRILQK
jgi:threonine synthase